MKKPIRLSLIYINLDLLNTLMLEASTVMREETSGTPEVASAPRPSLAAARARQSARKKNKKLCCRREAARCFVSVSSLLQQYCTISQAQSFYAPAPVGEAGALGGHRRLSSVCPSVRPSVCLSDVAYIGSNSKTKKPIGRRNFAQGYPRSHATPTPTSRSKGQMSRWGGGILWRPPSRTACSVLLSVCTVLN